MCGVANLDDAAARRRPSGLGVTPHQLPVQNGLVRCRFYELGDEWLPALDGLEGLVGRCGLGPVFFGITAVLLGDVSVQPSSTRLTRKELYPAS